MTRTVVKGVYIIVRQTLLILLSFFWLVFIPTLLLLFSPFYIFRQIVSIYVRKYRKDLGKLVSSRGTIMAVDDMQGKPECNIAIWFTLKGDVSVKEFQVIFKERVLNLINPVTGSLIYPELRQYYKKSYGFLFWKWDENFNLDNHIKICDEIKHVKFPITEDHMIKVNEGLLSKSWPEKQSPWSFLLVPNYYSWDKTMQTEVMRKCDNEVSVNSIKIPPVNSFRKCDAETLVIFHLHHGMADGYSLLKLVVGHFAGASLSKVAKPQKTLERNTFGFKELQILWSSVTFPARVLYDFSKQVLDSYDVNVWHLPENRLTRCHRLGKTEKIPISFIKEIKNAYNVSFSAVIFAATAGGIRNHFIEEGLKLPKGMHVFIPWPFPNHPDNKLINHLTGCFGELPLGKATARERLDACHQFMEKMRGSTIPLVNFYLCLIGGSLPTFMKDINKNYHVSGIWSNFPGTEERIYICGLEVTDFSYNVASLHGRTGFTVTALSYGQNITIDISIDKALAPAEDSAKSIISKIREEFNVLWNAAMA